MISASRPVSGWCSSSSPAATAAPPAYLGSLIPYMPPSTANAVPVVKDDAGEAR